MPTPTEYHPDFEGEERTIPGPSPSWRPPAERSPTVIDAYQDFRFSPGPRVRWAGVASGLVVALGVLMLLTALGLAIGISAMDIPENLNATTAEDFATGAGVWTAVSLLVAFFLAGMVATKVTDRADRGGAVLHGTLVWVLLSVFISWLVGSGISFGLSGIAGAVRGLAAGTTSAVTDAVTGSELTERLGLGDPTQVMARLDDPKAVSVLASATGMSTEEAHAALATLRARLEPIRDDPAAVAEEARNFLAQYSERIEQQARTSAATVQRHAEVGSWITFGTMMVTWLVAVIGALAGLPSRRPPRAARSYARW